jgi:hypothetical protein
MTGIIPFLLSAFGAFICVFVGASQYRYGNYRLALSWAIPGAILVAIFCYVAVDLSLHPEEAIPHGPSAHPECGQRGVC